MSMPSIPVYLDSHSTTPLDPLVLEEMLPWFKEKFGNASSKLHSLGWEAESGIHLARKRVAETLAVPPEAVVFTGSATEANHLAILGLKSELLRLGKTKIISSPIEHSSVLGALQILQSEGFEVYFVKVLKNGRIDFNDLVQNTDSKVGLFSFAWANHEIGTLQPMSEIIQFARQRNVWVHSDFVQAFGKVSFNDPKPDFMTISAHKVHGPKGVGALVARSPDCLQWLQPLMRGGGQEFRLRPGTQNVPAIVGFGKACHLLRLEGSHWARQMAQDRDYLWELLRTNLKGRVQRNGDPDNALPNNLSVSFLGIDGAALFSNLRKIAVSNASACLNPDQEESAVLTAVGLPKELAKATLRIGLNRFNSRSELDFAAKEIIQSVQNLILFEEQLDRG